jgi:hypothetical protein
MVDAILVGALVEGARMALQLYLTLASQAGLTDEQILEMLVSERPKFYANRPDMVPKPPEDETQ